MGGSPHVGDLLVGSMAGNADGSSDFLIVGFASRIIHFGIDDDFDDEGVADFIENGFIDFVRQNGYLHRFIQGRIGIAKFVPNIVGEGCHQKRIGRSP